MDQMSISIQLWRQATFFANKISFASGDSSSQRASNEQTLSKLRKKVSELKTPESSSIIELLNFRTDHAQEFDDESLSRISRDVQSAQSKFPLRSMPDN